MRFSAIFVAAASLATLSLAAPITKPAALDARAKSDIETLSYGLCQAEAALGVTALEDLLDKLGGGAITKIEDKLGVTSLEQGLGLLSCEKKTKAPKGDIQTLGAGLSKIEDALGITAIEDFVDELLGGGVSALEKTLGVTQAEKALGMST